MIQRSIAPDYSDTFRWTILTVLLLWAQVAIGCASSTSTATRSDAPSSSDHPRDTHASRWNNDHESDVNAMDADQRAARTLRLLDETLNTARLAAGKVATMPGVRDPLVRREILLHAALYRAGYEQRVARTTSHFVLEPVVERSPPDIGIESEEFRLRVLGALDDLGVPIAWVTETWRSTGVDRFPSTGDLATRLRISILHRDEESGVVQAEVGDWTAGGGASRQGVHCRWDGLTWQVERGTVRMVW